MSYHQPNQALCDIYILLQKISGRYQPKWRHNFEQSLAVGDIRFWFSFVKLMIIFASGFSQMPVLVLQKFSAK